MKILTILLFALPLCACTKEQPKPASTQLAAVAPQVKLDGPAPVTPPPPIPSNKKICTKGAEKHEFEIKQNGAGCVLNSNMGGKIKEEATSSSGMNKCERREKHLVAKLSHSGFQCN